MSKPIRAKDVLHLVGYCVLMLAGAVLLWLGALMLAFWMGV